MIKFNFSGFLEERLDFFFVCFYGLFNYALRNKPDLNFVSELELQC